MNVIEGDLIQLGLDGEFDVIIHGCNCMNEMGAGIARQIKQQIPAAWRADQATSRGSRGKLGTITSVSVPGTACLGADEGGHALTVVNAYTQYHWARGGGGAAAVDYDAVRAAFRAVKREFAGRRIAFPMIGAGLAGGDWARIAGIVEEELEGEEFTLVKFKAPGGGAGEDVKDGNRPSGAL